MRSIDRLREYTNGDALRAGMSLRTARDGILAHIDEIEREVADMVPLPVDADGVPIHVGDRLEWSDGTTFEVLGIGENTLYYYDDGADTLEWTSIDCKRHHHAPTVEDVLREMVVTIECQGGAFDADALISEYAAKLRLAGDGE